MALVLRQRKFPGGRGYCAACRLRGRVTHGFGGFADDPTCWEPLVKLLESQLPDSIAVIRMRCPSENRLEDSGRLFFTELNRLAEANPSAQVHIVSHSISGLIARYALEGMPGPKAQVASLTMFTPPNHGTGWAESDEQTSGSRRTEIEDVMARYREPGAKVRAILGRLYLFRGRLRAADSLGGESAHHLLRRGVLPAFAGQRRWKLHLLVLHRAVIAVQAWVVRR